MIRLLLPVIVLNACAHITEEQVIAENRQRYDAAVRATRLSEIPFEEMVEVQLA